MYEGLLSIQEHYVMSVVIDDYSSGGLHSQMFTVQNHVCFTLTG